jgi:Uma2 family endonuclease
MGPALAKRQISVGEYLLVETRAHERHEWLDGTVYLMAGGSPRHAALCAALAARLLPRDGRPCRPYSSDLRVRVPATGLITYPDLSVICGEPALDPIDPAGHTVTNPTVVVEVLSPSTADYDRNEKRLHYQQLPSVEAVLLVAQETPRIECYTRRADGVFACTVWGPAEEVRLEPIGVVFPVDEIYRNLPALRPG